MASVVNLWRVAGAGSVTVRANGSPIGMMGETESSKTFFFNIGDIYEFMALPANGWELQKWCADSSCSIQELKNPLTGTITVDNGNVYVYFMPGPSYVDISISQGRGSIVVEKNYVSIKTINPGDGVVRVDFAIGDHFKMTAYPDIALGYSFSKWCSDTSCTSPNLNSVIEGDISQPSGSVYAYFSSSCTTPNCGFNMA